MDKEKNEVEKPLMWTSTADHEMHMTSFIPPLIIVTRHALLMMQRKTGIIDQSMSISSAAESSMVSVPLRSGVWASELELSFDLGSLKAWNESVSW